MSGKKLYLTLTGLFALGYLWLGFNLFIGANSRFTICPIKSIIGIPCPSCGSTRSVIALLNGEYLEAIQLNPLGIILLAVLIIGPIWLLVDVVSQKETFASFYLRVEQCIKTKPMAYILIFAISSNWIWNIFKGL